MEVLIFMLLVTEGFMLFVHLHVCVKIALSGLGKFFFLARVLPRHVTGSCRVWSITNRLSTLHCTWLFYWRCKKESKITVWQQFMISIRFIYFDTSIHLWATIFNETCTWWNLGLEWHRFFNHSSVQSFHWWFMMGIYHSNFTNYDDAIYLFMKNGNNRNVERMQCHCEKLFLALKCRVSYKLLFSEFVQWRWINKWVTH